MKKAALILGTVILALAATAGWQIASCYAANSELQSDMNFLGAQIGSHIGLNSVPSDEDLRNAVIRKAQDHGIHLEPDQVTVWQIGTDKLPRFYFATPYDARVDLFGYPLVLHFSPTSAGS